MHKVEAESPRGHALHQSAAVEASEPGVPARFAPALRNALRGGYRLSDLRRDVLAGLVVGVVALPLSMALAIGSGVPPQHGIYTAIVGGAVIALLGGSPVQVSGPTAAFVVVLAPISAQYGLTGLLVATMFAGVWLILLGVARLGRLIEFVPYPVMSGFTAGIAVVIATLQLRDLLGLRTEPTPDHFLERAAQLVRALPTAHWPDVAIGLLTLLALLAWPRLSRRVPAALVALPTATLLALALALFSPGTTCETIGSRFGGIPASLPQPMWPWSYDGPVLGREPLTLDAMQSLTMSSLAIALLGAIESLLSAVAGAALSGTDHDPDAELIGQGVGNLVVPFFGGFAATGALARTAANIRSGARSPFAAVSHAAFLLVGTLAVAPLLGYLPLAAIAALLLLVAWNMCELKHIVHMLRVGPRSDVLVLVTCFVLTVVFDMTIAVTVGVLLAALLFMQRMASVTGVRLVTEPHQALRDPLPPGVVLYEVAGPLFFGAAERALAALKRVDRRVAVVVLDVRAVPVLDATGLVALESTLARLQRLHTYTVIAGVQNQPIELMARAGWRHREWVSVYRSFEHGVGVARNLALLVNPSDRGLTSDGM